ncbi:MAG: Mov34/MPN/PAD-1 family protein [Blautia sp.]|nr:Mov34/MPN/PAD-1 family protein [Blautia sp.]
MKAVFSDRAYAAVMAETTEKIQTETGGLFLGAVEKDTWYIIEAIDPGPDSVFEVAYFEYDQQYTQHLINKIANLYEEKLTLIGLWHRHPGSFDIFSSTDDGTNSKYARMRQQGAISALVNIDPEFRLTVYHVGQPCRYKKILYEVGDDRIPSNYLKLKTPGRFKELMDQAMRPSPARDLLEPSISLDSFMKTLKPLFEDRIYEKKIEKPVLDDETVREKIIDTVLSDILFMSDEIGIKMAVAQQDNYIAFIQDTVDGVMKLFFGYSEAEDAYFFQYDRENYLYEDSLLERLYHQAQEQGSRTSASESAGASEIAEPEKEESEGKEPDKKEPESRNIIHGLFRRIKSDRNGDEDRK